MKAVDKSDTTRLKGIHQIEDYYERPWNVIKKLIDNDEFPAKKIGGVWGSDKRSIDEWHRRTIKGVMDQTQAA